MDKEGLPQRRVHNEYQTPRTLCEAALKEIQGEPFRILDPGAGNGAWGRAARIQWTSCYLCGVELQEEKPHDPAYCEWIQKDFLEWEPIQRFDLIIGNPPWQRGLLENWIRRSFKWLAFGGQMVLVLPIEFLAGQNRGQRFWKEHPPERVMVLSKRPSWNLDEKGTNAQDCCLFFWRKDWKGETKLGWLL
jgi:tRNA1(Val) A37 N6-methylase TrmN6